jgi:hypothetical protein
MDIKESTSDLQKYYKKVLICKLCGRPFGSDLKKLLFEPMTNVFIYFVSESPMKRLNNVKII